MFLIIAVADFHICRFYEGRNITLTVENIISFVYLSRFKSFQKAADALYITQPTFSSRIKSLETDLGCRLVNREKRTVVLTEKGELFLPYAIRIFDSYIEARNAMKETNETIVIGSIRTLSLTILPSIITYMRQIGPETFINVFTDSTTSLLNSVLNQECQLAITEMVTHPEVITVPLFRDPIRLYAALTNPLHQRTIPLSLHEISRMKNICCNSRSTFWPQIRSFFEKHGHRLNPAYDIDSLEGLTSSIISGNYIGFLPELASAVNTINGQLRPLPVESSMDFYRDICIIYLKEAKPSYIDPLINYIQMTYREHILGEL